MWPNGCGAVLHQADPSGVASRSATLLPSCTFVIYLTLVATALGVTTATIITQDPWLEAWRPAVLLEKCHRGKLELQPMWLWYRHGFWQNWTPSLCCSPLFSTLASSSPLNCTGQMKISTKQFFSPFPLYFQLYKLVQGEICAISETYVGVKVC